MTEKELEIVVRLLVENVNLYSRTSERAKKKKSSYDRAGLLF